MNKWIFILPFSLLALSACKQRPRPAAVRNENTETTTRTAPVTVSDTAPLDTVLLDTAANVKGYATDKYAIPVEAAGTYRVTASSKNPGIIFVIQDADGNNVTDETYTWSGELKQGKYTLIVGLTRNAARKNEENKVDYAIRVVRK